MNIIEFIFEILKKFVKIDDRKLKMLENKGTEWYVDLSKEGVKQNYITNLCLKYGEHWAFQTFLAAFYIFAVRWVADFMNPRKHEDDDIYHLD